jgi:hypothetical protein
VTQPAQEDPSRAAERIAEPLPTAPSVPDLSREEMLAVIDWEFTRIGDREKTLGYTRWAAATALAITLWQITDLREISWLNLGRIAYLVVALSLALDSIRAVFFQLAPSAAPPRLKPRIRKLSEHLAPHRLSIAIGFVWSASVLVCTWAAEPLVPYALRIWVSLLYSLQIVLFAFGFAMAALDIKVPDPDPPSKKSAAWAIVFFLTWPLTALACWKPFISGRWEFASSEYRAAGLVVALLFLVDLLIKTYADAALEPLLLALRRAVGLGFLEPSDAAHQLEFAIHGEPLEEHLRSQLSDLQSVFQVAIHAVEEDILALDREKADLASRSAGTLLHPEDLLDRYAKYSKRRLGIQELFAKVSQGNESRFLKELDAAPPSLRDEPRNSVKQIHSRIDSLLATYSERIEQCRGEVNRLQAPGLTPPENK